MTATAKDVRRCAARALLANERAREATDELNNTILLAAASGVPIAEIADAAELSRQRIYQILGRPVETVRRKS